MITAWIEMGATIQPGETVAFGAAESDEIPYGRLYCIFKREL